MSAYTTLSEIINHYKTTLRYLYPEAEIRNFCFLIAEHLLNYSKIEFHTKADESISVEKQKKIRTILKRLANGEPLQYILGRTEFCGLPFKVDQRVLIPRPETEELVSLVVDEEKSREVDLLDIGTGSGCIAIALNKFMMHARVSGCDISEDILGLARINNDINGMDVHFFKHDILDGKINLTSRYHIIVSNPPYVRQSEKTLMHKNVVDFEPERALFVPDEDPLLFFRHIASKGHDALQAGGRLYLEINENFSEEVRLLLESYGYHHIKLKYDINGKPRIIQAIL